MFTGLDHGSWHHGLWTALVFRRCESLSTSSHTRRDSRTSGASRAEDYPRVDVLDTPINGCAGCICSGWRAAQFARTRWKISPAANRSRRLLFSLVVFTALKRCKTLWWRQLASKWDGSVIRCIHCVSKRVVSFIERKKGRKEEYLYSAFIQYLVPWRTPMWARRLAQVPVENQLNTTVWSNQVTCFNQSRQRCSALWMSQPLRFCLSWA